MIQFFSRNVSTCTFFQWTWVENLSRCSLKFIPSSELLSYVSMSLTRELNQCDSWINPQQDHLNSFVSKSIAMCFMNTRECMTRLSVNIDIFFSVPRTPSHKTCVTSEDLNCVTTLYGTFCHCEAWQPRFSFTWVSMIFSFPQKYVWSDMRVRKR